MTSGWARSASGPSRKEKSIDTFETGILIDRVAIQAICNVFGTRNANPTLKRPPIRAKGAAAIVATIGRDS